MRSLWLLCLVAIFVGVGTVSAVSPTRSQQATVPKDAPDPQASAPVALLLESGDKRLQSKQYTQVLATAEQALAAAVAANDDTGQALAQRQRAQALQSLDRPEEAIQAWKLAADAWKRVEDGPGQVEALGMASLLLAMQKPTEVSYLWDAGLCFSGGCL